jgi:hypothetical protein
MIKILYLPYVTKRGVKDFSSLVTTQVDRLKAEGF